MTNSKMAIAVRVPLRVSLRGRASFYLYLSVMLLGLFLRNALSVNLPPIFFLLVTLLSLLRGDQNQIIATAVCCIPFSTGFQFKYALLLCIVVLIFKNRKNFRMTWGLAAVWMIAIWELLHGIGSTFSLWEYPRSLVEFLLLGVVLSFWDKKSIDYRLILRGYSVAMVGVCFIMFYLQLSKNDFNILNVLSQNVYFRFGEGNTSFAQYALNFNPNGLGFACCLVVMCCLFFLRKREFRLIDGFLLFFSVGFCLMTLSRTAFLCLAFLVLGDLFLFPMPGVRKLSYFLLTVALITVVVTVLYQIMPGVFDNLFSRFEENDLLNGRDSLQSFYNQHIFSSPLYFFFGIGVQSISQKIFDIYGGEINVPHNGYQEAIVVWGILGFLLVILLLFSVVQETRGEEKRRLIAFVPLGLLLLFVAVSQLVTSEITLMSILLVTVVLNVEGQMGGEQYVGK